MFLGNALEPVRSGPGLDRPGPSRAGPARPRAKNENVNFHILDSWGQKVKNTFAAKYAIWKHLDSSSLQIVAKVAS